MTEVTQADRDAAEPFRRGFKGRYDREVGYLAEAFARHREAAIAPWVEALQQLHHVMCGDTGFMEAVRLESGKAYPWDPWDAIKPQIDALIATRKETDHV